MQNIKNKAFTLVELLVVITILAIISVVAYQNFWGAVDKAVSWRKISDVSTIETSLQQYKVDNNYYPKADLYDSNTNLWWYNSWTVSTASNKIVVTYNWEAIKSLDSNLSIGWWEVYWTWAWNSTQIWAKWTVSINNLTKKYLSKDLYDPELWDLKIEDSADKMIDHWIWRYVYATYKKSANWPNNQTWVAYNIAYTIKKQWSDTYVTKIVWDYDIESCYDDKDKCPETLIWLVDSEEQSMTDNSSSNNYGVPYAVTDFAE